MEDSVFCLIDRVLETLIHDASGSFVFVEQLLTYKYTHPSDASFLNDTTLSTAYTSCSVRC